MYSICPGGPSRNWNTASAFLHIFAADNYPDNNEKNIAMLYVIGPAGMKADEVEQFKMYLSEAARNSIKLVNFYNEKAAESKGQLPKIENVRWYILVSQNFVTNAVQAIILHFFIRFYIILLFFFVF